MLQNECIQRLPPSNALLEQTKLAQLILIWLRCSQAVANGCQVIVLEESVPECPAAASFAATAALSGYGLTIVSSLLPSHPSGCLCCGVVVCIRLHGDAGDRQWEA